MKKYAIFVVILTAVFCMSTQALASWAKFSKRWPAAKAFRISFRHPPASSAVIRLGEALFKDLNLSRTGDQSCMTCHHPLAGFTDPSNHIDPIGNPVSDGSAPLIPNDPFSFGNRNAPSAAYAGFSPPLACIEDGEGGLFCVGGTFWDGRATGVNDTDTGGINVHGMPTGPTFDPLADQAKGPFQNPVEMGLTPEELIEKVLQADYKRLFRLAFGYNVENYAVDNAYIVYNDIAIAIAAFERSRDLNKFSSKFDEFAKEQARRRVDVSTIVLNEDGVAVDASGRPVKTRVFMPEELEGLALFNMPNNQDGVLEAGEGGNCAACHPSGPITEPTDSQGKTLFTDFSYDNLGIPINIAANTLHFGSANAADWTTDTGLYATLTGLLGYSDTLAAGTEGLFKVPSLRNVAVTPPYGHNGFFPTLYSIVHFYNTRIAEDLGGPEIGEPNTEELGALDLSKAQEEKIVLFMETLTDR